ncbi:MAG: tRNA lysidine(34) synthetase TilS [Bacteroidetes bacterium]|nr:tRNA lysidine(34) synthetase TilS [Bacteroidota bacterium]
MLTKFKTVLEQEFPVIRTAELYLAISGGKDSMTLSHLLLESGIKHTLLHCNFQLRGKESDQDEAFLRAYAATHQLEIHVQKFDTAHIAEKEKQSIQECARKLRYDWFRTFLNQHENSFLLTAHHLDDSIETFFINLFRGTGFRGLSGIPVNANQILRPLSGFTAEEIYRYIDACQIDYRSDSSNAKKDYLRNKIRHDLIPVMADLEPDFRTKMTALFGELSGLKSYLDAEVYTFRQAHQKHENGFYRYRLQNLNLLSTFFREQLFRPFGIHRKNAAEFEKFLAAHTGAQFKTTAFRFLIDRDDLVISETSAGDEPVYIEIAALEAILRLDALNLSLERKKNEGLIKNNPSIQQLDFEKVHFPLVLRTWQQGDKIKPLGMTGTKLISDILIDKKINLHDKARQLVLADCDQRIICLPGLMVSEEVKVEEGTTLMLEVQRHED